MRARKDQMESGPETNPSFIRWQKITITQLGFLNNVVLVLTVPSIAFALNKAPEFSGGWKYALLCGVTLLMLSGVFALVYAFTRLLDFRLTAQIVAMRRETAKRGSPNGEAAKVNEEQNDQNRNTAIELLDRSRTTSEHLSDRTWSSLRWQLLLFSVGVGVVVSSATLFIALEERTNTRPSVDTEGRLNRAPVGPLHPIQEELLMDYRSGKPPRARYFRRRPESNPPRSGECAGFSTRAAS